MLVQAADHDARLREKARRFEEDLPPERRKQLGQFFTGVRLGKLLAHLALTHDTRHVIDPMAGHGDLLAASVIAAQERRIALALLTGMEVDGRVAAFCNERLSGLGEDGITPSVVSGNAFERATLGRLPRLSYDLAIANPPYVRYQSRAAEPGQPSIRADVLARISELVPGPDRKVWETLAQGYSGLADLSVPAWMLSAALVRPGGRLALVVPATWRTREYGDVIRYLMLRCFRLEYLVEDIAPGWFSDALVRTHLVVARRLTPDEVMAPVASQMRHAHALRVAIAPEAANEFSLVGSAFGDDHPERSFAAWMADAAQGARIGISVTDFDIAGEWSSLSQRAARRRWYEELEGSAATLPLFAAAAGPGATAFESTDTFTARAPLSTLEQQGIHTGQGLRTGCNRFFYVDALGHSESDLTRVRTSSAFDHHEFAVPTKALRPVLRKQAELSLIENGETLPGRALDLRGWVLPEDADAVQQARPTYEILGEPIPELMPAELAAFVRRAAEHPLADDNGQRVPELSAVRTNVSAHRRGLAAPRFWYMLPNFRPRHQPDVFIARVNHGSPWAECNRDESILVDANFSALWIRNPVWTRFAVKAFLNSNWAHVLFETLGTPMGGGALKLEAVQLRRLPVPHFSADALTALDRLGRRLARNDAGTSAQVDALIADVVGPAGHATSADPSTLAEQADALKRKRSRSAA